MLAQLCHFRGDNDLAIPLIGIVVEIALMVIFRNMKLRRRQKFGHHRRSPFVARIDLLDHPCGNLLLLR